LSSLLALLPHVAAAAEGLHRTWTLYHSLDPKLGAAGFTKRGVVTLTSGSSQETTDGIQLTIENDEEAALEALSISQMMESGWYQLQLVEEGSKVVPVQTTIPACQLRRANFRYVSFEGSS
jgi:hypothetical protein